MAAVSDVAALDMPVRPIDVENPAPPTTLLDGLSVDILTKIASSLDYRSLFNLERVSEKCQHAVVLHFGRKSSFMLVSGSFQDNDSEWKRLRPEQKVTLLSRLTGLRELDLTLFERRAGQQLLNWMVTASTGWLQLEKLTLELYINGKLDPTLVGQLCSNCTRLTDVTLKYGAMTDAMVKAVLTARHGELRRLGLGCAKTKFKAKSRARLAAGLAGCARLESLGLCHMDSVVDCLPPGGLPALRHLSLVEFTLTDAELAGVVERQPGLESVSLVQCYGNDLTQNGLAVLGQLPALSSFGLWINYTQHIVSDWVLDQLSKAPLTELTLSGFGDGTTAEGLLRLTRSCPALRWATLWEEGVHLRSGGTIDCRSDAGKQELIRTLDALKTSVQKYH